MKLTDWAGLTIENNTIIQKGNITNSYGEPVTGFVFRNNIVFENEYGIKGDNMGSGQQAIDKYHPGGKVTGNIIIGGIQSLYREPNFFPASVESVGFRNWKERDLRLGDNSLYRKAGSGGGRIGADLDPPGVG